MGQFMGCGPIQSRQDRGGTWRLHAEFLHGPGLLVKVEVFEVPETPVLTQTSPGKGRFQPVNA